MKDFSRIDFFVRKSDGEVILNENQYHSRIYLNQHVSKLWDYCGVSYSELIDRLIRLGLERNNDKTKKEGGSRWITEQSVYLTPDWEA